MTHSERHSCREVFQIRPQFLLQLGTSLRISRERHVAGHNHALLSLDCVQDECREKVPSLGHAESRATCTVLSLDNLVTAVLHALRERLDGLGINRRGERRLGLGEERDDGDTAVSTNDGDAGGGRQREVIKGLSDEGRRSNDVKSRNTEDPVDDCQSHALGILAELRLTAWDHKHQPSLGPPRRSALSNRLLRFHVCASSMLERTS